MRTQATIYKTLLAGVITALASLASAEVVTDANGYRYYISADGRAASLTYLATDSTNATAYMDELIVPATVKVDGRSIAVTGLTNLACGQCSQLTSVSLPEGVTSIGLGVFSDCTALREVSLPSTLTTLHDLAFYRDSSLLQMDVPAATRRIGASAFAYCCQLDSVGMEQGLHSIARQAFYYCPSLQSVYIPGTVSAIGEYAFAYATSLSQIMVEGDPIAITPDVFEGVDVSACRLIVPSDQVEAYREADVWCDFQIIDGGYEGLPELTDEEDSLFDYSIHGEELWLNVKGDAPALVYDLTGRRIAVAASHSGETHISLTRGQYIIRCGKTSKVILL